ncbi:MAG TPA: chorismate mutase [Terriglobales bacterium]|nr:chorismate mutase [Terriglobales bacterium]
MDISAWRRKIDELDRKLAALLNERAAAAVEIGRLKRNTSLPIYEPDRERAVITNVQRSSTGPLSERDLAQIYERIMDVMRSIQKHEIVPEHEQTTEGLPSQTKTVPTNIDSKPPDSTLQIKGRSHERRKR